MKKITIETKSKTQMVLGVMKKVEQAFIDYDLNKFDPNFSIKIFNEKDESRVIILRITRSALYDDEDLYRYFLHLCVGVNEGTTNERVSTYDIMDYYDDYVNRKICDLVDQALPYDDGDTIKINILCNEPGVKNTWFDFTEDDEELDSVETFVDSVVIGLVNILSDSCPSVSIFFEYELRNGVKSKMDDNDAIFLTIQKSEINANSFIVGGSMPSSNFDGGRDFTHYPCCHKDLRGLLIRYLGQLFKLRKTLLFDEHMKVTYFVRSIEQYKITL